MIHLAHVDDDEAIRRCFIVGDAEEFLTAYCTASDSLRRLGITWRDWTLSPRATCDIDLGGMEFENAPQPSLDVDGDRFTVSLTKAAAIAAHWANSGGERVPGWWRARGWLWFYVMPVPVYRRVTAWLEELGRSPAAAAAIAEQDAALRPLRERGVIRPGGSR